MDSSIFKTTNTKGRIAIINDHDLFPPLIPEGRHYNAQHDVVVYSGSHAARERTAEEITLIWRVSMAMTQLLRRKVELIEEISSEEKEKFFYLVQQFYQYDSMPTSKIYVYIQTKLKPLWLEFIKEMVLLGKEVIVMTCECNQDIVQQNLKVYQQENRPQLMLVGCSGRIECFNIFMELTEQAERIGSVVSRV